MRPILARRHVTMAAGCAAGRKSVQYFRLTALPGWKTSATLSQGRLDELSLSFCPPSVAGDCAVALFRVRPRPETDRPVPRRRGLWGPGTQAAVCGILGSPPPGRGRAGSVRSQGGERRLRGAGSGDRYFRSLVEAEPSAASRWAVWEVCAEGIIGPRVRDGTLIKWLLHRG